VQVLVFRVEGPVEEREVKQQKGGRVRLDPIHGGQGVALLHQGDMFVNTSIM
jgi:hypothetical protein